MGYIEKYHLKTIKRVCLNCGKEFDFPAKFAKQSKRGRYCSIKCSSMVGGKIGNKVLREKYDFHGSNNPNYKDGKCHERSVEYKNRFRAKNPEKAKAHDIVKNAKAAKLLIPNPCQSCGSTEEIHAHHDDYSKPLQVTWLCRKCHIQHHKIHKVAS
jgi:hypothetical protein